MSATTSIPSPAAPRRRSIWWWIFGGAAACFAIAVISVLNAVTLNRDAAVLRNEVLGALKGRTSMRIQVSAGPGILMGVRAVLHCIDRVPKEAHAALAAVRSASVGVYRLQENATLPERVRMFASADKAMSHRGWTRIVGVNDGRDTVLIYTPKKPGWTSTQRVCLAVCDGDEVVIVAGAVDPDALADLAQYHRDLVRL